MRSPDQQKKKRFIFGVSVDVAMMPTPKRITMNRSKIVATILFPPSLKGTDSGIF
jgi:hypothetical protein